MSVKGTFAACVEAHEKDRREREVEDAFTLRSPCCRRGSQGGCEDSTVTLREKVAAGSSAVLLAFFIIEAIWFLAKVMQ